MLKVFAWGMSYLPMPLFHRLLQLIDAVASRDFVWPMACGVDPYDLHDTQRRVRRLATRRFELVDGGLFRNVGNLWACLQV